MVYSVICISLPKTSFDCFHLACLVFINVLICCDMWRVTSELLESQPSIESVLLIVLLIRRWRHNMCLHCFVGLLLKEGFFVVYLFLFFFDR